MNSPHSSRAERTADAANRDFHGKLPRPVSTSGRFSTQPPTKARLVKSPKQSFKHSMREQCSGNLRDRLVVNVPSLSLCLAAASLETEDSNMPNMRSPCARTVSEDSMDLSFLVDEAETVGRAVSAVMVVEQPNSRRRYHRRNSFVIHRHKKGGLQPGPMPQEDDKLASPKGGKTASLPVSSAKTEGSRAA